MFQLGDHQVEAVESFIFLGSRIEVTGEYGREIHSRLSFQRTSMSGLTKIWKDKDVTIQTKRRLVNAMVVAVAMYGCESWTVKKKERTRLTVLNCNVVNQC